MKIIEPNVELLVNEDNIAHVCKCARICYRKETGNDEKLYENLINRNHLSMLRHATEYYIIPINVAPTWINSIFSTIDINNIVVGIDINTYEDNFYIVVNGQWSFEHPLLISQITPFRVTTKEFENANEIAWRMMRYTFKITTQISTTRELNRVSPNNIAEQSTRYVYGDGNICRPHWMSKEEANEFNNNHQAGMTTIGRNYINSCIQSFGTYKDLIEINGLHRQDARGALPVDTATVCAYTYSSKEWQRIINLRYHGITGQPHSNAKIIAGMIREQLNELGYKF